MKRFGSNSLLAVCLIAISAIVYWLQITIFHDPKNTFFYLFQDLAFVPAQVLLVSLVVNDLLTRREKAERQKKMNMVIGVFFSEVGTSLLKTLYGSDARAEEISETVRVRTDWSDAQFAKAKGALERHGYAPESRGSDLRELKRMLLDQRGFLLGLLENPNLLEHESFTELLWAVFHLAEELNHRQDVNRLHETDFAHVAGDMRRAYILLVSEWLSYLKHLKEDYPYIFSLVVRTNPLDPEAAVEVK